MGLGFCFSKNAMSTCSRKEAQGAPQLNPQLPRFSLAASINATYGGVGIPGKRGCFQPPCSGRTEQVGFWTRCPAPKVAMLSALLQEGRGGPGSVPGRQVLGEKVGLDIS